MDLDAARRPDNGPSGLARAGAFTPVILAVVAEAAWITVVAGLLQEYVLAYPTLDLPVFAMAVALGAVTARLLGPRLGERWPVSAAVLTIGVGAAGWLLAPDARATLGGGDLPTALGIHPGGWLVGVAFLRGTAYARLPISEPRLARLLGVGIAGLAVSAIAGGMISEPWRGRFLADALTGTTVFAASATLGLSLVRLSAVGADAGFDWRRNPIWAVLVVALVLATAGLALPASRIAGPIVTLAVGAAIGPLLLIALVAGFTRKTIWVLAIVALIATGFVALVTLLGARPSGITVPEGGGAGGGQPAPPPPPPEAVITGAVLALAVAMVAIVVLVRLWGRRQRPDDEAVREIRMIDRGEPSRAGPRLQPRRRRRAEPPSDAVAAYRALVADLDGLPDLRREAVETPAEHARRLRASGRAGLSLELLAADYALARFGAVALTPAEHRRAVRRWQALRGRLRHPR
jgi:hypothetical protein